MTPDPISAEGREDEGFRSTKAVPCPIIGGPIPDAGIPGVTGEEVDEFLRDEGFRCRCVWHGVPCDKDATQEDGFCDWCGVRRAEDMRGNPFAQWSPEGKYLGLAGGTVTGYNHQAGWGEIPDDVRPTACWMERPKGLKDGYPFGELNPDNAIDRAIVAAWNKGARSV